MNKKLDTFYILDFFLVSVNAKNFKVENFIITSKVIQILQYDK